MNDYILLMHNDVPSNAANDPEAWSAYFARLRAARAFEGGSAIGDGVCVGRSAPVRDITRHLAGYIRIQAGSLAAASELVTGNPVYEAGGTVEIRELPRL